jgi:hypothetical protein
MEPRKTAPAEADVVQKTEGSTGAPDDHGRRGFAGVEERGTRALGHPRNLGDLVASSRMRKTGRTAPKPEACASRAPSAQEPKRNTNKART